MDKKEPTTDKPNFYTFTTDKSIDLTGKKEPEKVTSTFPIGPNPTYLETKSSLLSTGFTGGITQFDSKPFQFNTSKEAEKGTGDLKKETEIKSTTPNSFQFSLEKIPDLNPPKSNETGLTFNASGPLATDKDKKSNSSLPPFVSPTFPWQNATDTPSFSNPSDPKNIITSFDKKKQETPINITGGFNFGFPKDTQPAAGFPPILVSPPPGSQPFPSNVGPNPTPFGGTPLSFGFQGFPPIPSQPQPQPMSQPQPQPSQLPQGGFQFQSLTIPDPVQGQIPLQPGVFTFGGQSSNTPNTTRKKFVARKRNFH